LEITEQSK